MIIAWILYIIFGFGTSVAQKNSSVVISVDSKKPTSQVYIIVISVVACIFFFITSGFNLKTNLISIIYSLVFAVICILSNLVALIIYRYFDVANVAVVNNVGTIILTTIMGLIIFDEKITFSVAVKVVLMIIAVILVFLSNGKGKRFSTKNIRYLIYSLVVSSTSWLILKLYSNVDNAASNSAFCFYTNLFMLGYLSVWLSFKLKKSGEPFSIESMHFGKKELFSAIFAVVTSNASDLVRMYMIGKMDMVVVTPIITALGLIVSAITSVIYREKLNYFSYIAIAISIFVAFA